MERTSDRMDAVEARPEDGGGRGSSSSQTSGTKCEVRVSGADQCFSVPKNDLLLMSAIGQGIDYPHNCRVGSCGKCKTRLVSGRISPMFDFALSPLTNDELKQGYILACQSKVRSDLVIDVKMGQHATLPVKTIPGRVTRWMKLPGEVIDLRLKLEEPLQFQAGQYCTIAESGSFTRRSYSFYDAPPAPEGQGADEVGFLVKRLPGGKFSEWLFAKHREGTRMWLEGPFGTMGIDDRESDALCVAGGTGLAPILSIVANRLAKSQTSMITIVFGVRTAADTFASERLSALLKQYAARIRLVTILSHEPATSTWSGPRGLITEALAPNLGIAFERVAAFVCGSLPMVEAVERNLLKLGVPQDRIHADKFLPTGF